VHLGVGWARRMRRKRAISMVGGMEACHPQHDAADEDGQCTRRKSEATNQTGRCRSDWPPVGLSNMRRSHLRPPTSSSQLALLLIDSPWLGRISVSLSALVEPRQQFPVGPLRWVAIGLQYIRSHIPTC
jgi:hypothetical protein